MTYQSIKGFRDILPDESARWQWMEGIIHALMHRYGCGEVRLPIVEATDLFSRGVGQGTDIVGKEMYTFLDRSVPPESLTLRPELTASAARAYVQHSIAQAQQLARWYYIGPMFRYEQPQAGRYRQFHQFGMEIYGSPHPEADAEVILAGADLLGALGIRNYRLRINSLGEPDERTAYRTELLSYLREHEAELSPESVRRMEQNPLRVLDSKREQDVAATAGAPRMSDFLGEESRVHFEATLALVREAGIEPVIDHRLVRGLDYYTRTAFEFQGMDLGAQDALGGGGRYDRLIEEVGGKPAPSVGFSFGMERLLIAAEAAGALPAPAPEIDAYVIGLDDASRRWAMGAAGRLRSHGIAAECDLLRRSLKAQMRDANRKGARCAVIVGESELAAREAQVKNLGAGEQKSVPFDELPEAVAAIVNAG
ncbi:MAG: histidine--tRNA ligase [Bacteroidetes bacterium]|nr:histidine--tRNA ligase [Bacteroidota bacterium]